MKQLTKRERIIILLEHYEDYWLPSGGGAYQTDDGPVGFPPRMSRHPSVIELCRCLKQLEQANGHRYRHVKAFYTAEKRTAYQSVPVRLTSGKWEKQRRGYPARIVPGWVRDHEVRLGVDFIVGAFEGEPFIPSELMAA